VRETLTVARREFVERARDRTFLFTNALILLLLIGSAAVPLLFGDDEPFRVAATGTEGQAVLDAAQQRQEAFDVELDVRPSTDRGAAEAALRGEEIDAVVDGATTVLVREDLPGEVEALLSSAAQGTAVVAALAEAGLPPEQAAGLVAPPSLTVEAVAAREGGEIGPAVLIAAGAAVLLYGLLVLLGQFIAQGIVEEKSSRVVEVLLSAVRPVQLLAGKVLGLGALGLVQLLVLAAVGVAAALVVTGADLPPGAWTAVLLAIAWFVLGYAQYASLYAIVGAVASRVEDLQTSALLAVAPLVAAFFAAQSALREPDGLIARAAGLLPFSAPLVQPIRVGAGVVPWWEPLLAIMISLATAVVLVVVAARFYTGGVLQVRRRISFGAAWRGGR